MEALRARAVFVHTYIVFWKKKTYICRQGYVNNILHSHTNTHTQEITLRVHVCAMPRSIYFDEALYIKWVAWIFFLSCYFARYIYNIHFALARVFTIIIHTIQAQMFPFSLYTLSLCICVWCGAAMNADGCMEFYFFLVYTGLFCFHKNVCLRICLKKKKIHNQLYLIQ